MPTLAYPTDTIVSPMIQPNGAEQIRTLQNGLSLVQHTETTRKT